MFRAALPITSTSNSTSLTAGDRAVADPASSIPSAELPQPIVALSTRSLVAAVIVVVWVGSGVVTAAVLARRGHELRTLAPLGVVVGPFLIGLAWSNYIVREAEIEPVVVSTGSPGAGSKSLLVAVLGEPDDVTRVVPLLRSIEDDLGEVALVRPIPFEAAQDAAWDRAKAKAAAELHEATRLLPGIEPHLLLVPGRAETTIIRHAVDHGFTHVVCIGSRRVHEVVRDDGSLMAHGVVVVDPESDDDVGH